MKENQSANALEVRDVVKIYGTPPDGVMALKKVSLDIRHNEFFTLLGPSGCGKTTLLRLFAGFEEVTEGEIFLYGEEIEDLAPHQRPVNTVFQHYALFPHMTVRENIAFGLQRLGKPKDETARTVREMLALVHMEEFGDRRPTQMSGGQMQRVALARALAPHPKVLLLDEPLSALDLKLRQAMRDELQRLQRETGITFVFVTHDQDEALSMSDRVAVMSNGEIQQIGSPEDIYKRPANRFVADFIGDTNLIDVTAVSSSADHTGFTTSGGVSFDVRQNLDLSEGTKVTLNIRPENVILSADGTGIVSAKITNKTFLGQASIYSLDIGDGAELKTHHSNQEGRGQHDMNVGDTIGVDFAANSIAVLTS